MVAPLAGAWIEITNPAATSRRLTSLPLQERGLKLYDHLLPNQKRLKSLPSRECGLKSDRSPYRPPHPKVAPFAGAWIEIFVISTTSTARLVVPFAGAWIEISQNPSIVSLALSSLPPRECGLKSARSPYRPPHLKVAPFGGAWIEIACVGVNTTQQEVAPLAGAWIEIILRLRMWISALVVPLAGAWIEIWQNREATECVFTSLP